MAKNIFSYLNPLCFFLQRLKFWQTVMMPFKPPNWDDCSNEVVMSDKYFKLRKIKDGPLPAILVIPPHAGRHGNVALNLIRVCQKFKNSIYVFELLPADAENKDCDLNRLVGLVEKCLKFCGQSYLIGICQGAWLSAIAASFNPGAVRAYFNFAGPIDFKAGNGKIKAACEALPIGFFKIVVNSNQGIQPGWAQWWYFTMMNPLQVFFGDQLKLHKKIKGEDEEGIKEWENNRKWFWSPQNLPGVWYLEAVERLFMNNEIISGLMEIGGRRVDLHKINCPVFLYAGGNDEITPSPQVFSMEKYVSGQTTKRFFDQCGHTSVFCGQDPLVCLEEDLTKIGCRKQPSSLRFLPEAGERKEKLLKRAEETVV